MNDRSQTSFFGVSTIEERLNLYERALRMGLAVRSTVSINRQGERIRVVQRGGNPTPSIQDVNISR